MTESIKRERFLYLAAAILGLLTLVTYAPTLWYDFQFDDRPNILKFYDIRHHSFASLFFLNSRWISYWLNTILFKLGGYNPFYYRFTDILIHLANGLLVLFLFNKLLGRFTPRQSFFARHSLPVALLTSLLFLLHPVQTQTVSYIIQGQLEGLSTLFVLLLLVVALLVAESSSRTQRLFFGALLCVIALFSTGTKEIAIVSPALLLLIDWFFLAQGSLTAIKRRWWIHALVAVIVISCYIWLLGINSLIRMLGMQPLISNFGNVMTGNIAQPITPLWFMLSQGKVVLHYLAMYLVPIGLCADYDWVLCKSFGEFDVIVPALALIGITAFIGYLLYKDKRNLIAFGLLWFFICIAPRSSFIPSSELVADYKSYLASIGWLFVITSGVIYGITRITNRMSKMKQIGILSATFAIIAIMLMTATYARNLVWSDGYEFWNHIIHHSPRKARAYNNFGVHALERNERERAIWAFRKAADLEPDTFQDPYVNLGALYERENNYDLAIIMLRKAILINPYKEIAWFNLGNVLKKAGKLDLAERAYLQAVELQGHYGKALFALGSMALDRGDREQAYDYFKRACTNADVDFHPEALQNYAEMSLQVGNYADAFDAFSKLVQVQPNNLEFAINQANAAFLSGQLDQAMQLYQQMVKQCPPEIDTRPTLYLAETYCAAQQFEKALPLLEVLDARFGIEKATLQKAWCYMNLGKQAQALEILMQFKKTHPKSENVIIADQMIELIRQQD